MCNRKASYTCRHASVSKFSGMLHVSRSGHDTSPDDKHRCDILDFCIRCHNVGIQFPLNDVCPRDEADRQKSYNPTGAEASQEGMTRTRQRKWVLRDNWRSGDQVGYFDRERANREAESSIIRTCLDGEWLQILVSSKIGGIIHA